MKNIWKIEINPICYLVAFIYIITGTFRPFFWITVLIFIHEMGHVLAAIIFKWNIERVVIMPMGGITIFKESLNRPIYQELIIALVGPIIQLIFYMIVHSYVPYTWFYNANIGLLLFNLLPIIPLDGSKILHCIMDILYSYQVSHKIILWISIILLFIFGLVCFYMNNLIMYIMFLCIVMKVREEYNTSSLRFQKFLLERYLYSYHFKETKKIFNKDVKGMYRDYNHVFFINNHWVSEKKVLGNYFKR